MPSPNTTRGRPLPRAERAVRTTAILGPTNTGKTHMAIERMLTYDSGIMGLPLRLLAREVYNRVIAKVGTEAVALITGEEKIKPPHPRYWISTVEAMPRDLDVAFVALDEIQLGADLDRGHVFTDRLLNRRGREETMLIGAGTMGPLVEQLMPGVKVVSRPRLSKLTFAGPRKLSRLPHRTAIVAFSAEEVYAIAELIRRQRGGAAVVLGALSPRTRNAQVELYQNGDVDYIVATDAIGMGLNLDVDHVAFAGDRKYDGWHYRRLHPAEFGQIAGRAGRHIKDGTFGTTGRCPPFDEDLVVALEEHRFDPVTMLQWRNTDLDFSSIESLQATLDRLPDEPGLTRAPLAEDLLVLDIASHDEDVRKTATNRGDVQRLWEVCQTPDYRKLSPAAHAELVLTLYRFVVRAGRVPDAWFQRQLSMFDRTDGDIDALSARIAQVRTFNYIANRPDWLGDPEHWQGVTRQVEDNLSDALHERLAHRFVDRRTSVLMRRLRENAMLEAEITSNGDVLVEGQQVGQLQGFRFTPDPGAAGEAARTLNAVAQKVLAAEIERRATRVNEAVDTAFVLAHDGLIRWLGEPVGRLSAGDHILRPVVRVLADDQLTGAALEMVQKRLDTWLAQHIKKLLGPLLDLEAGEGLEGLGRGIAFQIGEALGVLERSRVANDLKTLDQAGRAALRKFGVRFGAYHLYLPLLLKPAPRSLAAQLWALKHGGIEGMKGLDEVPHLAASGRTSFAADKDIDRRFYLAAGFRVSGERAVRVDILERLADLIRPAINYRPGQTPGDPPPGTADRDGFVVTVAMTSLAGCSGEQFASILKSLNYASEKRKGPAITVPLLPAAPTTPVAPATETESTDASEQTDAAEAPAETTDVSEAPAETVTADATAPVAETPAEVAPEAARIAEAEAVAEPQADAAPTPSEETPATENTAPAEEPEIEVWHPARRHQHHGPRHGNRPQRDGQRPGGPRPEGQRHFRGPRRDQPAPTPAEGGETTAATQTAEGAQENRRPDHRGGQRPDHRGPRREGGGEKRHFGDRPPRPEGQGRPDRKPGEGRPGGRPDFKGNRDRRPDRGGPAERQFASSEKPRGRDKAPDPDSPFAKLAALKAQLEGKKP
jgi:ATP-dependent RNA helicase SUPV3L1/SUV3